MEASAPQTLWTWHWFLHDWPLCLWGTFIGKIIWFLRFTAPWTKVFVRTIIAQLCTQEFRTFHGFNGDRNSQTFRPWLSLWGGQTNQRETTHPNINKTDANTQQLLFRGFSEHLLITGTGDSRERVMLTLTHDLCEAATRVGCAPRPVAMATLLWKHWFLGPRERGLASRFFWFTMYEDGKKCWITYQNNTSDSVWHPLMP